MTRDTTTVPIPTITPTVRPSPRLAAWIAAIVVVTVLLLTWGAGQLRTVDTTVDAVPAAVHQSIRQVEHAEQVDAHLRRLHAIEAQRFANRYDADLDGSAPLRRRPGVQP